MIGLCGDCDGKANDLKTLRGTNVAGKASMFADISTSYIVDESVDNVNIALGIFGFSDWYIWWRHQMETYSALLAICAGNSPVTGEFPAQRAVTRSFDV